MIKQLHVRILGQVDEFCRICFSAPRSVWSAEQFEIVVAVTFAVSFEHDTSVIFHFRVFQYRTDTRQPQYMPAGNEQDESPNSTVELFVLTPSPSP